MTGEKKQYRKGLVFILDGLGDLPCPQLNGRTPLEAANTPKLDSLVRRGLGGLVDLALPGKSPDTHTGTALLFGVTRENTLTMCRGPIEAAGAHINVQEGDVVIRCNFATLEPDANRFLIKDRRAGRIAAPQTEELSRQLQNMELGGGISGSLYPATQHRAVLHLTGKNLSSAVSDSDPRNGNPMYVQTVVPLDPEIPHTQATADALNRFVQIAYDKLSRHSINKERKIKGQPEANGIICRGAGAVSNPGTILHETGLHVSVVTGSCTIIGLAELLGYHIVTSPNFTALADTDIPGKIDAALHLLEQDDLVFVHFKAPDICAHDKDPLGKKLFIERFDQALHAVIKNDNTVIAVTGDHSTDSNTGEHSTKPVPSLLFVPDGKPDPCCHFGENTCRQGSLQTIRAELFLQIALSAMGRPGFHPLPRV